MKEKKIIKMQDIVFPTSVGTPTDVGAPEEEIFPEPVVEEIAIETGPESDDKDIFAEGFNLPEEIKQKPAKERKKFWKGALVAGVVLFAIILISSSAKTKITIKARTEMVEFQTELTIDKNIAFIDLESSKIPGQFFQIEKEGEKEFPTTQEKELKESARGVVTVYNAYNSAPQTLVKGTRFVSEKGKVFRTTKIIVIPGAQVQEGKIVPNSVEVELEASEPGDKYNIEPTSFTIPGFKGTAKYTGFYGESAEPMAGGIIGKVKVVSEEDFQGAKDILTIELQKNAKDELRNKIPTGLEVLDDIILEEVLEVSSSVKVGAPAEKFTLKVKVLAKVLGFNKDDAISLINDNFQTKLSEDKMLMPETIDFSQSVIDINMEEGMAKLLYDVKEKVIWKVDTNKIREDLAGMNEVAVRQYIISRTEIENVKISFSPFWIKKVPSKENKIKISVE